MTRLVSFDKRRAVCAAAIALMVSVPVIAWAQGSTPQPPPAAASPAKQAPAPAESASGLPTLSDAERAAARAEVQRQLKQMADSLQLTKEQRDKARPIMLDAAYQLKQVRDKYAAMEKSPANREAMTKEVRTLREGNDAKLAAVLSPEQMAKYKAMRDVHLTKARAKMGIADSTAKK
jgi:hypothetical protein